MKLLSGYHFTPWRTWVNNIQTEGLKPYPITESVLQAELIRVNGNNLGIWIWPNTLEGASLYGSIFDRVACHHATELAVLQVNFPDNYRTKSSVVFNHSGCVHRSSNKGDWVYHSEEPFMILNKPVPASQITLLCYIDVTTLLSLPPLIPIKKKVK